MQNHTSYFNHYSTIKLFALSLMLTVGLTFSSYSSLATAKPGFLEEPPAMLKEHIEKRINRISSILNLTEQQTEQLESIMTTKKYHRQSTVQTVQSIKTMIREDQYDPALVSVLIHDHIAQLQVSALDNTLMMHQFYQSLSETQQNQFDQLTDLMKERKQDRMTKFTQKKSFMKRRIESKDFLSGDQQSQLIDIAEGKREIFLSLKHMAEQLAPMIKSPVYETDVASRMINTELDSIADQMEVLAAQANDFHQSLTPEQEEKIMEKKQQFGGRF